MKKGILLSLLALSLLAGCSGETKNANSNSGGQGDGSVVELTFWRPQASEVEDNVYVKRIEEFNQANKGKIHVKMEVITRGNSFAYEDKINAAVASHTLPDVLAMDGPNIANYAASEIIIPLDEYFSKEDLDDFVPSILQQGSYQGKFYAPGLNESSVVLFYNKKIMAEHGITPPDKIENAWTWDEWYDVMKKTSKDGVFGTNMINDKGEWMTYAFEQLWISGGTDIVNKEGTTAEGFVNSPQGVEAAEFLQKLANEKLFNIDPKPTEFEEGKAATKLGGPWNIPGFKNYPDLEWGITYFPKKAGGTQTAPSGSWAVGVSVDTKHPKEAAEVIKWITNKDSSTQLAQAISMPASRKSAFESLTEYNELPLRIIKEQVTGVSHARPVTPAYPVLTQKFAEALTDIMVGADVKKSLDNVASTYDEEYKRNFAE
ncbi:fructooligosaccharide transport system substrate-binding protein [Paenibacillus sophorae]|uniref:ABC transporter substrate-binding protein n=1 Tax=Paenibacillus sophorae TaxID=1333845 RepID=A0A1H8GAL2_9BACL|nr:ABC transporter substrate-binding protein [Paenibacillus sophorae]QWU14138.1 ABC transporter substrate-binding protein [Paenibacillus sophorae]SEN40328.1 fructooligosaccharide transport system substrate-binding protein [Paenibacillus sophorae]